MVVEVILPKIGMAMQDAIIITWWKKEGDSVKNEEPLFDMETEKVTETINSPADGIIKKIFYFENDTVDVGEVVAEIQVKDEGITSTDANQTPEPSLISEPDKKDLTQEKTSLSEKQNTKPGEELPISPMRQTIARRMKESLENTAQLTLMREVDVTNLVSQRELHLKSQNITFTDIFIYLVARELQKFPKINSKLENNKIITSPTVNIGVAVALPDGLVVPVIYQADQKSIVEIAQERVRLVDKVKSGGFSSDDLSGGTFTITNLGNYGIEFFTPIINLPEVAILGLGKITKKPVVINDEILIRSMLGVSLTIDHRVVDGAPGAEFLESLAAIFQNIDFQ